MFDGSECTLPTAHAHIDTPFFKGNVIALVVSSPVADKYLETSSVSTTLQPTKIMWEDTNESQTVLESKIL